MRDDHFARGGLAPIALNAERGLALTNSHYRASSFVSARGFNDTTHICLRIMLDYRGTMAPVHDSVAMGCCPAPFRLCKP
jgi:hypothetical protein